jgi:hypothetical protein
MNRISRFAGNLAIDHHRIAAGAVRVEAWRRSGGTSTLVGACVADAQAKFDISASAPFGSNDAIFFRVVVNGVVALSSEGMVECHPDDPGREITLVVPADMSMMGSPPGGPSVSGVVLQSAGGPMAGVTVRAFDEMLRHEVQLGQATTDAQGHYLILYAVAQLAHKGGRPADLLVRAYDAQKNVIGQSPILFRAPAQAQINVVVGGAIFLGFSEYEQVQQALTPELDGASAAALSADDITFLTKDTALDPVRVQDYADASRIAPALGVAVVAVYGLLREGLPADAQSIEATSPQRLRDALNDAVASNIVPASVTATIDAAVAAIAAASLANALAPPPAGQINVGTIVSVSGAPKTVQQAVLQAFSDPTVDPAVTWPALRAQAGGADAAAVDRVQLALQLGALTHNHPPLVAHLMSFTVNGKPITSLQDLSGLTRVDWFNMLAQTQGGQVIGVPVDVPGDSDTDRQWTYATTLARGIEEAFPSAVLAARLAAGPASAVTADLTRFLGQSAAFHLVNTPIDAFVAQNPAALAGVSQPDATVAALKGYQRLARVTPRIDEIQTLAAAGLTSAHGIALVGQGSFVNKLSPTLGTVRASIISANASQVVGAATALYARYNGALNSPVLPSVSWLDQARLTLAFQQKGLPKFSDLFGSQDACACDDCRSITSPAAYLFDLFQFMGETAREALRARRPDLFGTFLSCANTNTPMPYIDLVNEVLEAAVVQHATTPPPVVAVPQTTRSAEELAANPENLNRAAYTTLAKALFPWTLPFSLDLEEARVYLQHLGVDPGDLTEVFASKLAPPDVIPEVRLDLTPIELDRLTALFPALLDPVTHQPFLPSSLNVATFLQRNGLAYEDLLDLLYSEFVHNPDGQSNALDPITVTFAAGSDCDLTSATFAPMTTLAESLIERFTRLRRKLGWTAYEVDAAFRVFGSVIGSPGALHRAADAKVLRDELHTDVVDMLSWWGPTQTKPLRDGSPSLYATVFQNRTALSADDLELVAFTFDPALGKLQGDGQPLATHVAALASALGVGQAELQLIVDPSALGARSDIPAGAPGSGPALTFANVNAFYRIASLSRALGLSVRDFLLLRALTSIDPFQGGPAATRALLRARDAIDGSPFTLAELGELLIGIAPAPGSPLLTEDAAAVLLADLQASLLKIAIAEAPAADTNGDLLRKALAAALPQSPPALLDSFVAMAIGPGAPSPSDQQAFHDALDAALTHDTAAAIIATLSNAPPVVLSDRFGLILDPLRAFLRTTLSTNLVVQKLAVALHTDARAMRVLLTQGIQSPSGATAMAAFLALVGGQPPAGIDLGRQDPAGPFQSTLLPTLILVAKAAIIVSRFKMSIAELTFTLPGSSAPLFAGRDAQIGWVTLNQLPVKLTPPPPGMFARWQNEVATFAFRDKHAVPGAGVFELLSLAGQQAAYNQALATLTGWAASDLDALTSPTAGLKLTLPQDYASGAALDALSRCQEILARLGASANQALAWATDLGAGAADIKAAAKAKHDRAEWLAVAAPIRDILRVQQRDALVAWLVGNAAFDDDNALFDHYLIDVEMSACMRTSRVKQAIGSAQLFVQRALMNLEHDVAFTAADATQWKWRGRLPIWQANRSVLLYPENFLEPTLRDDMTPFFRDLVNELGQVDVTSDSAETAYRHYLEKLQDVSRLAVVATYQDPATSVVHVLARTPGRAPKYYYRDYSTAAASWTPWTSVPLDITDDQIALIVWNRHVTIVWLAFSQPTTPSKPDIKDPTIPGTDPNANNPTKSLEVRLAWSALRNGKWSQKRVSDVSFDSFHAMEIDDDDNDARDTFRCEPYTMPNDSGGEDLFVRTTPVWAVVEQGQQTFRIPGCGGEPTVGFVVLPVAELPDALQLFINFTDLGPGKERLVGQSLQANAPGAPLVVHTTSSSQVTLLAKTPVLARAIGPSDGFTVVLQAGSAGAPVKSRLAERPFFYRDERRSFFVLPGVPLSPWPTRDTIDPSLLAQVADHNPYIKVNDSPPAPAPAPVPVPVPAQPPPVSVPVLRLLDTTTPAPPSGVFETLLFPANDQTSDVVTIDNLFSTPRSILSGEQSPTINVVTAAGLTARRPSVLHFNFANYRRFTFKTFHHPYVCEALGRLNRFGLDGLLSWRFQEDPVNAFHGPHPELQLLSNNYFKSTYWPSTSSVATPYPVDEIDVTSDGAYSIYNWEVFFHAPLLIAQKLTTNQRFDEAKRWLEFVFDPTDTNTRLGELSHFWKFKKFFDDANSGGVPPDIADLIGGGPSEAFHRQVQSSNADPFNPFALARLRPAAFERATVLAYIDNLIAWGDNLFRQNSLESINEATLLYVMASELLGARPRVIEAPAQPLDQQSYDQLVKSSDLGELNDPRVALENVLGASLTNYAPNPDGSPLTDLFFCVPQNQRILGRWDIVADRLFKVRHCMNIEGQVEQLPLFEPPIDPALLIRAAAAGVDLGSVLGDLATPLPFYRFQIMSQKASELAGQVRGLGQELLAALEKKDAEKLALLRADQELKVLQGTLATRQRAIDEAQASHDALVQAQAIASARQAYYDGLLLVGLIPSETQNLDKLGSAAAHQASAQAAQLEATMLGVIPDFAIGVAGFGGSPESNGTFGGTMIRGIAEAAASVEGYLGALDTYMANRAAIQATQQRRAQEWTFQSQTAQKDLGQIAVQITGAAARIDMATNDLATLQTQIDNATDISDFLRGKYSNEQLYDFMVNQISATYFTAYQLAYDVAKRAERAFHREIGDEASPAINYIQFGYWDSLQKGLLAGNGLEHDLKRMEAAYLEQNRRELEITKHVSLLEFDPVALTQLKETGACFVFLPESLFDRDFPGHYMRRIKSVAATIPCEVGPYTSVNCTLSLVRHTTRWDPASQAGYARQQNGEKRFTDSVGVVESIVTSSGQGDGGLFEVNLRDERYLPFEGAGAVSLWRIDLPADTNAFDTTSITDLVMHLRYTARDGGDALKAAARPSVGLTAFQEPTPPAQPALPPVPAPRLIRRLFRATQDFSDAFYRFLHPDPSADGQSLGLELGDARFPFHAPAQAVNIQTVRVFLDLPPGIDATGLKGNLLDPAGGPHVTTFAVDPLFLPAKLPSAAFAASFQVASAAGGGDTWTFHIAEGDIPAALRALPDPSTPLGGHTRIDPAKVIDVGILCDYTLVPGAN